MVVVNTQIDGTLALASAVITLQRNSVVTPQAAPPTKTVATILTPAELLGGLIVANPATAVSYQLPLATDLDAALLALTGPPALDDSFWCSIVNIATAANITTLTTNSGWTLVGNMAVAGATAAQFLARRTAAGAFTLYRAT